MDQFVDFCGGSQFWNQSLLWNTSWPRFSPCFRNTALVWGPSGWLWLTSLVYFHFLHTQPATRPVPHCALNITKMVVCVVLSVVSGMEAVVGRQMDLQHHPVSVAFYLACAVNAFTFLLAGLLTVLSRKAEVTSSCVLFQFWFLTFCCHLILLYSVIIDETMEDRFVLCSIQAAMFFFITLQLILCCFSEPSVLPALSSRHCAATKPQTPELRASFPSKVTFHWVTGLVYKGYRTPLTPNDVWEVPPSCTTSRLLPVFMWRWTRELASAIAARRSERRIHRVKDSQTSELTERTKLLGRTVSHEDKKNGCRRFQSHPSLFRVLLRVFYPEMLCAHAMRLVADILQFANPVLLSALIDYIENKNQSKNNSPQSTQQWKGWILVIAFFVITFLYSIFFSQNSYRSPIIAMKIKTALVAAIFGKSLTMSNETKKAFPAGSVVNLMSVDCQRIQDAVINTWILVSTPVQVALAVFMLYNTLGVASMAGVGVLVAIVPLNVWLSALAKRVQAEQFKVKDERVKMTGEILSGIKVIKMYAWESCFEDKIRELREQEVKLLRTGAILTAVTTVCWICLPVLMTLANLATYMQTADNLSLSPNVAFVTLSVLNVLRQPLSTLPSALTDLVQAHVSLCRIRDFLSAEDICGSEPTRNPAAEHAVLMDSASFTWERQYPTALHNISLKIPCGKLVMVVGGVGAGKSSLLSAILGEMKKVKGLITVKQSNVSYVPQEAWLQGSSVRDNVVFGHFYNECWYHRVISACALKADIDSMPGKDLTEIGEKGGTLSGGQRQRLSVARAVYHKADLILLDDPLSALDTHVAKHLFTKVLSRAGLLRHKTRILVTHAVHYLPSADYIIVMEGGHVTQAGSYEQLMSHDGPFAQYLKACLLKDDDDDFDDPEIQRIRYQMLEKVEYVTSDGLTSADEEEHFRLRKTKLKHCLEESLKRHASSDTCGHEHHDRDVISTRGGTLMSDELAEEGKNTKSVFVDFSRAYGLWSGALIILMLILYQGLGIAASVWLSMWTAADTHNVQNESNISNSRINSSTQATANTTGALTTTTSTTTAQEYFSGSLYYSSTASPTSSTFGSETYTYLSVYCVLGILQGMATLIFVVNINLRTVAASKALHAAMLASVLRQPMSFFDITPLGRLLNRFSRDVDVVDGTVGRLVVLVAQQLFTVLGVMVVVSYTNPLFLGAAIPLLAVYYTVKKFYAPCSRQLRRLESNSRSPVYSHFTETLSGAMCIRAFGAGDRFVEECARRVDDNNAYLYAFTAASRAQYPEADGEEGRGRGGRTTSKNGQGCSSLTHRCRRWLRIRLELLGNLVVVLSALFAVLNDSISGSLVGLSVTYALQVTSALNSLVQNYTLLESTVISVERIVEYSKLPQEPPWEKPETRPERGWPSHGDVSFVTYSASYREGLIPVLKSLTCHITGGQKVGIVGRTGAGKSSLTQALFRLIEASSGSIIIDGIDIASLGLHDLRRRLTILPQEPVLFNGTLRFNLDPECSVPEHQLWDTLQKTQLMPFIQELDGGLDYQCGEEGRNLSVGQRQLVCLARCLIKNAGPDPPTVLILDEATAAVDMALDEFIQQTVRTAFQHCTVFAIAHRIQTVLDYDKIMVLESGEIIEFDTPSNLLGNPSSTFHSLAREARIVV